MLLMIPAGSGEAGPYQGVASAFADRYTVITYDRRGFSRSRLDGPPDDARRMAVDCEDALRLLDHVGGKPAHIFGSSSGAIVAIDLITRYPDRIAILVAHEPPLINLLPDRAQLGAFFDDVYATYRNAGVEPAMQKFLRGSGIEMAAPGAPGSSPPPPVVEMMARPSTTRTDPTRFWRNCWGVPWSTSPAAMVATRVTRLRSRRAWQRS